MITNGYATLQQVKDALRITDAVDDSLIEMSIEAASREIDSYCQRVFYSITATRTYRADDNFLLEIDDLVSLSTLKTTAQTAWDTTWGAADYQLEPTNGIVGGLTQPYTRVRAIGNYTFPIMRNVTVQVVGVFGWSAVPIDVRLACVILSQRLFKRFDSPLGVVGMGDLGAIRVSRIDSDVQALLAPYAKVSIA
jgi:hypothetical protein